MDGLRDVLRGYGYEWLVGVVASLDSAVLGGPYTLPLLFPGHIVLGTW